MISLPYKVLHSYIGKAAGENLLYSKYAQPNNCCQLARGVATCWILCREWMAASQSCWPQSLDGGEQNKGTLYAGLYSSELKESRNFTLDLGLPSPSVTPEQTKQWKTNRDESLFFKVQHQQSLSVILFSWEAKFPEGRRIRLGPVEWVVCHALVHAFMTTFHGRKSPSNAHRGVPQRSPASAQSYTVHTAEREREGEKTLLLTHNSFTTPEGREWSLFSFSGTALTSSFREVKK